MRAIETAYNRTGALIVGPPGTGKNTVIDLLFKCLVRGHNGHFLGSEAKPLVTGAARLPISKIALDFASEGRDRCIARLCAVWRSSEVSGPENYERAGGPAHRGGSRLLAIIAIVTVGNQEVPETLEETVQVVPEDGTVGRPSTLNMCEVSVVMSIAERFFKSGARLKDMGVISPYTGHNAEIKKAVAQFQKDTPYARGTLDVGTVDAFQGKEENIVISSTVRCSSDGSVGHVADLRRLTFALTSARQGLLNSLLCKSPPPLWCLRGACSLL